MQAQQAREEEFGSPSWVAVVLAVALAMAVASPFLHATSNPPAHATAPRVTIAHVP